MDDNILEISGLNVFYRESKSALFSGSSGEKQALYDVSLSVKRGEVVGIAGESGCGKSTLAKTIVGMNKRYSGDIRCADKDPQMVFQDPYGSLNPMKRIEWLMEEPLRVDKNKKWTEDEKKARIREVLRQIGMDEAFLKRYPSELSGGQRQRICIGIALMRHPSLLIADEPVSALDVTIQAQIIRLFQELHERLDLTLLFISHDLRVIWQLCSRIVVMRAGRIVEEGPIGDVYRDPQDEYTRKLLEAAGITG